MYEQEREVALATAREANLLIQAVHTRGAAAAMKDGHPLNLVTATDVAVEKMIIERLSSAFPGDEFLGEESGAIAPSSGRQGSAARRWIIDPLCGTRNFAYRLPAVATNIALLERDKPVLGVVAVSPGSDLVWAVADHGAYARQDDGSDLRLQVSAASHMVNIDFGYALYSGQSSYIAAIAALIVRSSRVPLRAMGSSAPLALQAQGLLAGNLFQQSKPWDITAGCLLCQEAGAIVTDFTGGPWHPFGPTFLVASDQATYDLLRAAITGAPAIQTLLEAWQPPQN